MKRWLIGIAIVVVVLVSILSLFLFRLNQTYTLTDPITVVIADNSGTEGTMQTLYDAGVIKQRWVFLLHVLLSDERSQLRADTYTFYGELSVMDVIHILTQARSAQTEVEVTLVEGWTNQQIADALAEADVIQDPQEFLALANAPTTLNDQPLTTTEGFLFPDTYRFFIGDSNDIIIKKMLGNFNRRLTPELRDQATAAGHSLYDVITLASIVEKEAAHPADQKIVADIFWRRLAAGKRLESDVTILYGMAKADPPVTTFDTFFESPYNTYRQAGLPPTPIANPGLGAIEATINPTPNEYWYFLATPSGEVIYSKTFEEHLAAQAKHL